ncbi:MAG: response regulator transcription factor, partial [Myxococcales bacterium]|nr:response regulator transcription factor [Myxococcales bacterium]
ILLTSRQSKDHVVEGLDSGADDYVAKPFHPEELRLRIRNGMRLLELQENLAARIRELEQATRQVNQLQDLLPLCTYCKRIRTDENYWLKVDSYLAEHLDVRVSHGICPSCYDKLVEPEIDRMSSDG